MRRSSRLCRFYAYNTLDGYYYKNCLSSLSFAISLLLYTQTMNISRDYEEAMNRLPIYERAVIKNVIEKIRYDEYWGDCFNELEKRRDLMKMKEAELKLAKNRAIGIMCVGTVAYSCAVLITR